MSYLQKLLLIGIIIEAAVVGGQSSSHTLLLANQFSSTEFHQNAKNRLRNVSEIERTEILRSIISDSTTPGWAKQQAVGLVAEPGSPPSEQGVELLLSTLNDPEVQLNSAQLLRDIGKKTYKEKISNAILSHLVANDIKDTSTSVQLLYALSFSCENQDLTNTIMRIFRDTSENYFVRGAAGSVLARCEGVENITAEALRLDEDGQRLTLQLLGQMGVATRGTFNSTAKSREAVEQVVFASTNSPSKLVRLDAINALRGVAISYDTSGKPIRNARVFEKINDLQLREKSPAVLSTLRELKVILDNIPN